jgi:hypothetical protein
MGDAPFRDSEGNFRLPGGGNPRLPVNAPYFEGPGFRVLGLGDVGDGLADRGGQLEALRGGGVAELRDEFGEPFGVVKADAERLEPWLAWGGHWCLRVLVFPGQLGRASGTRTLNQWLKRPLLCH